MKTAEVPQGVVIEDTENPSFRKIRIPLNSPIMGIDELNSDIQRFLSEKNHKEAITIILSFEDGSMPIHRLTTAHLEDIEGPANFSNLVAHVINEAREGNRLIGIPANVSPLTSVEIIAPE